MKILSKRLTLALSALLAACASTTAVNLIGSSEDTIIPSAEVVRDQLAGRPYDVGEVRVEANAEKGTLDFPNSAYAILLQDELEKAFDAAKLRQGEKRAPNRVNAVIEVAKFNEGRMLIPDPSVLQVRMEVTRPDGSTVMRGRFRAGHTPTVGVFMPGMVGPISVRQAGADVEALSKTIPAMAVTFAHVTMGLRRGDTLESMELFPYPDRYSSIPVDRTLKENELGIRQLSGDEIDAAVRAARGP